MYTKERMNEGEDGYMSKRGFLVLEAMAMARRNWNVYFRHHHHSTSACFLKGYYKVYLQRESQTSNQRIRYIH